MSKASRSSLALVLVFVLALVFGTTALAKGPGGGKAHQEVYKGRFVALNGSGVSGTLQVKARGGDVRFLVNAAGLTEGTHDIAVTGFSGTTTRAVLPPSSAVGTDGVLTQALAQPFVGDSLLALVDDSGVSPSADASGALHFVNTFGDQSALRPFGMRLVVIYGGVVNGSFDPTLPVAVAAIQPVNHWAKVAESGATSGQKGRHGHGHGKGKNK